MHPRYPCLAALVIVLGIVWANAAAEVARETSADTAAYRATGNLHRLAVMRVAIGECDFPDESRTAAMRVMDETRKRILHVVKREAATPGDDAERKRKMAEARDRFSNDIRAVLDESQVRAAGEKMNRVVAEIERLAKPDFAAAAVESLSLTPQQADEVNAVAEETQDKLGVLDAKDGVPVVEKRTGALLAARTSLREILTEDQRRAWDAQLDEQRRKESVQRRRLMIRGAAVPPPPAPPPP